MRDIEAPERLFVYPLICVLVFASVCFRNFSSFEVSSRRLTFSSNQSVCEYGTAPGIWVDDAKAIRKWVTLGSGCPLHDYLTEYALSNGSIPGSSMVLLSDSIDRYLLTSVCNLINGTTRASFPSRSLESQHELGGTNVTAYGFHFCDTEKHLKIAATYFPGVHPTGPFHRNVRANYRQRIDYAARQWALFHDKPPDMVVVSSLLWDLARMHFTEKHLMDKETLSKDLVEQWTRNYTAVVDYAKKRFSKTSLWSYHTVLPPRMHSETGLAVKPYLGGQRHVEQLNAAGVAVAQDLGMHVVDYLPIGSRFMEGQAYLVDLIHPRDDVNLEVANIYLNLIAQHKAHSHTGGHNEAG